MATVSSSWPPAGRSGWPPTPAQALHGGETRRLRVAATHGRSPRGAWPGGSSIGCGRPSCVPFEEMSDRAVVFCLAGLLSWDGPVHIGLLRAFTGFPENGRQDDDLAPGDASGVLLTSGFPGPAHLDRGGGGVDLAASPCERVPSRPADERRCRRQTTRSQTLYGRRPGARTPSSRPRRDFAGDFRRVRAVPVFEVLHGLA
jgi:hypothetical protein